ncbi:unnamed protein product [Cyprideis torosa]|uniref:Carbonic anhydrase n=1 Tax=Cyprideis torosa TaxID=163714 RepID=A0A7R8WSD7_9CRUS|nr:unnamed protein product [Cyprideis torosa]CAG0908099.1 unnamed protein product [Cyprideis torosa]
MISGEEALARLKEGNARYVAGQSTMTMAKTGAEVIAQQTPFAVILGCSDSRVPAEIVFDQGVGDLFVIRVAGNIVAPSQVGSVEFAVEQFGTRLVMVLGHSHCGAVAATLSAIKAGAAPGSRNINSIVDRIRPSVETLLEAPGDIDDETLTNLGVRANVRASVSHLSHGSQLIENYVQNEGLIVVGAEYSLATGEVEFLDGDTGRMSYFPE